MPTDIRYDKTLNHAAGYAKLIDDNDLHPRPPNGTGPDPVAQPLRPQDGKTLLNLIHHLLYTFEGRDLMRNNKPAPGSTTLSPESRAALTARFSAFGVTDSALQEALLDAHLAAELWVRANELMPDPAAEQTRDVQEKIYLQKMSFITWCLWEDAKAHEFSMGW